MSKRVRHIQVLVILLCSMIGWGCTSDPHIPDTPQAPHSMYIHTSDPNYTVGSPVQLNIGDLNIQIAGADNELIHSYFVVFVHNAGTNAGKIAKIETRSTVASAGSGFQQETMSEVSIPEGSYLVYSFANLTQSEVENSLSVTFAEGATMPNIDDAIWAYVPTRDKSTYLPMANKQTLQITSRQTLSAAIEVVRLAAKMQFVFTNYTEDQLEVLDYWFRPIPANELLLGQQTVEDGINRPIIPDALLTPVNESDTVTFHAALSEAERLSVPVYANTADTRFLTADAFAFYMPESQITSAMHPTGQYLMSFRVRRVHNGNAVIEDVRYALTPNVLQWICRNDYIIQPIGFADYVLEPEVMFYPPIGGYPEAEIENEQYGQECYCRFKTNTEAEFALYPRMRRTDVPNHWYHPADPEVTAFNLTIADTDGIFATQPAYDEHTGEILGTLNGQVGKALITINATINGQVLQRVLTIQNIGL